MMRQIGVLGLVFGMALWGAFGTTTHVVAAQNTECNNQTLGTVTVNGNLIVPAGAFCNLNGTHVKGNAEIRRNGGLLAKNAATIDGGVLVDNDAQFAAFSASTVGGNVRCYFCGVADLHQAIVKGSLIDFGLTQGAFIQSSQIRGSLSIMRSKDGGTAFTVTGNSIGHDFQFDRNTGSSNISGNTITGDLECSRNQPPPAGSGNVASEKEGECAHL